MRLFRFYIHLSGGMALLIAVASITAGACNTLMLAVLNRALAGTDALRFAMLAFIGAVVLKLGTSYASEFMLIRFAGRSLCALRDQMALQIMQAPLRRVERLGSAHLISLLTGDIEVLNGTYLALPYFGAQAAMLAGGALYLGWLSPPTLFALVVFSLIAFLGQRAAFRVSYKWLERARHYEDLLLGHFRGLTDGLKQLKLNRDRRALFLQGDLASTSRAGLESQMASGVRFSAADHLTQFSLYVLIGMLLFAMPNVVPVEREVLSAYILTVVFLMGPLRALLGAHGKLMAAEVSVIRVEELSKEIHGLNVRSDAGARGRAGDELPPRASEKSFRSIEMRGIALRYEADGGFALGPIDGCLNRGEILFVTGGNGSGKTTLVKVLCGLYEPDSGSVTWDGVPVVEGNRDDFRQLWSGVFADHHLFDRPVGTPRALEHELPRLLRHFRIEHRVSVVDGRFPDLELSRGQRARLAFVLALLEDRPIYVFDEWAAEQDPTFRRRFYEEFVPELKARGKTVVVITHDDRFFHLADRLWHVSEGKCVERDPRLARTAIEQAAIEEAAIERSAVEASRAMAPKEPEVA